jgi:hypothetical protein
MNFHNLDEDTQFLILPFLPNAPFHGNHLKALRVSTLLPRPSNIPIFLHPNSNKSLSNQNNIEHRT